MLVYKLVIYWLKKLSDTDSTFIHPVLIEGEKYHCENVKTFSNFV